MSTWVVDEVCEKRGVCGRSPHRAAPPPPCARWTVWRTLAWRPWQRRRSPLSAARRANGRRPWAIGPASARAPARLWSGDSDHKEAVGHRVSARAPALLWSGGCSQKKAVGHRASQRSRTCSCVGRSGQARTCQARLGQARPGQARPGQARPGQARPGQKKAGRASGAANAYDTH
jgi:hypothetical protein